MVSDANVPAVIPAPLNVNPLTVAVGDALAATAIGMGSIGYAEPAAIALVFVHVTRVDVTATQFHGEPVGTVPNVSPDGKTPVIVSA